MGSAAYQLNRAAAVALTRPCVELYAHDQPTHVHTRPRTYSTTALHTAAAAAQLIHRHIHTHRHRQEWAQNTQPYVHTPQPYSDDR